MSGRKQVRKKAGLSWVNSVSTPKRESLSQRGEGRRAEHSCNLRKNPPSEAPKREALVKDGTMAL